MLNKKEIFNLNGKADWFNYEEVHTIFLINNQIDILHSTRLNFKYTESNFFWNMKQLICVKIKNHAQIIKKPHEMWYIYCFKLIKTKDHCLPKISLLFSILTRVIISFVFQRFGSCILNNVYDTDYWDTENIDI